MAEKNNSFHIYGKVFADYKPVPNSRYEERYLLVETVDPNLKYKNQIQILVNGQLAQRANIPFTLNPTGLVVEIFGYINGRYYQDTGKLFQTLKASFISVKNTGDVQIEEQETEYSVDADDLPF